MSPEAAAVAAGGRIETRRTRSPGRSSGWWVAAASGACPERGNRCCCWTVLRTTEKEIDPEGP